jgi:phosphatidylserine/phosphatidylglycerophosphate/cardiolipin synthase-like enzyme
MVIDHRIVIAGAFNYIAPATAYNDENLFVIGSPHEEVGGIVVEVDSVRDIVTYMRAEIERIFALIVRRSEAALPSARSPSNGVGV